MHIGPGPGTASEIPLTDLRRPGVARASRAPSYL